MNAEITNEGLKINGSLVPPSSRDLDAALGAHHRDISVPLHGGGLRRIRVFDSLGIAYFLDDTPPEVSTILFVLHPEDAPQSLGSAFSGSLCVNGEALTAEMTEAVIPLKDEFHFEAQHGHWWRAATPMFTIWLVFVRRKNRVRKRSGAPRLAYVSVCYS